MTKSGKLGDRNKISKCCPKSFSPPQISQIALIFSVKSVVAAINQFAELRFNIQFLHAMPHAAVAKFQQPGSLYLDAAGFV